MDSFNGYMMRYGYIPEMELYSASTASLSQLTSWGVLLPWCWAQYHRYAEYEWFHRSIVRYQVEKSVTNKHSRSKIINHESWMNNNISPARNVNCILLGFPNLHPTEKQKKDIPELQKICLYTTFTIFSYPKLYLHLMPSSIHAIPPGLVVSPTWTGKPFPFSTNQNLRSLLSEIHNCLVVSPHLIWKICESQIVQMGEHLPQVSGWTYVWVGCFRKWWYVFPPKSSICSLGFSIINHPFWGTKIPLFLEFQLSWHHPPCKVSKP